MRNILRPLLSKHLTINYISLTSNIAMYYTMYITSASIKLLVIDISTLIHTVRFVCYN